MVKPPFCALPQELLQFLGDLGDLISPLHRSSCQRKSDLTFAMKGNIIADKTADPDEYVWMATAAVGGYAEVGFYM